LLKDIIAIIGGGGGKEKGECPLDVSLLGSGGARPELWVNERTRIRHGTDKAPFSEVSVWGDIRAN